MIDGNCVHVYSLQNGGALRVSTTPTTDALRLLYFPDEFKNLRESTGVSHEALAKALSWDDLIKIANAQRQQS